MPDMILIEKELFALLEPSASVIWALCGARLLGMMLTVPFFSSRLMPLRFRGALIAILVFVVLGGASTPWRDQVASLLREGTTSMLALFASEVLIGMAVGWAALLVLAAIRAAAILISEQVGFGFGGIVDPSVHHDEPVLRAFYGSLAIFVLLAGDVHLRFLRAVGESFAVLPPGTLVAGDALAGLGKMSLAVSSLFFQTTLILVLPVTAALFLASVAQGVLTRLFPELETVFFGFLLRSVVAFGVVTLGLPLFVELSEQFFGESVAEGGMILRELAG